MRRSSREGAAFPGKRPSAPFQEPTPRRRFGQNFLVDGSAARRIVEALSPAPGEAVLEIGPGRGALTGLLVEAAGRIAAVELDRDLAALLRRRIPDAELLLIEADVLRLDLATVAPALGHAPGTRLVVVGNLPYNISKPTAMKLVDGRGHVGRAVLLFQREVAERLAARPGSRAYGPLTVLAGRAYAIERLGDLPPGAFRPRPKVVSTLTRWTPRPEGDLPREIEPALRACLRASFGRRRQTLLANLRACLPGGEARAREVLEAAEIEPGLRAEAVPPEGFLRLAAHWPHEEPRPA